MREYKKLKDYGIIGNLDTCALINKDGVVEWYCFPHMESPSVFASILDVNNGGYFMVQPAQSFSSTQKYIKNSNVLQTDFVTASGTGALIDFMPVKTVEKNGKGHQAIFRKAMCKYGQMNFRVEFTPIFNYARSKTTLKPLQKGVEAFGKNLNDHAFLYAPSALEIKQNTAIGEFLIRQGESLWFVLRHNVDLYEESAECEKVLQRTLKYWQRWAHTCRDPEECFFQGPLHDLAVRSGLILKLLMNWDEGSIAAAATTSIPEDIGGVRNWDYRYNWVRDASFAIQAFYHLGHIEEAGKHLSWFTQVCKQHQDPADIQPLYGMYGKTKLSEEELYSLEGYRGSRPVRVGNKAYGQKQLDVYGELINAFYETTRYGKVLTRDDWLFVEKVVNHVCTIWKTEDSGIWEMRSEPKHFVYSKVMCWVALDRGIKIAESKGLDAPLELWNKTKKEIENLVLERGFNKKLNSLVQSFDSEKLDASNLLIPMMGFLPFDDPRIQGTIDAVLKHLTTEEKLVYRYKAEDGVHGGEGTFLLCSFWLVKTLALSGRIEEAESVLASLLRFVSPTGLLSEEVDRDSGELLGNFPQAFSHIGLINSVIYLNRAKGKKHKGPAPLGA
jgi:GH15 family glucan-1,4-alpha-glucosidase